MIDHCVWDDVSVHVREWNEQYGHYSNHFLMDAGGIGNQQEKYLNIMSRFASAYSKSSKEKRDNMKRS